MPSGDVIGWLRRLLYPLQESRTAFETAPAVATLSWPAFGREALCDAVTQSALDCQCVLLFGGRQSGKTTILLRIAERLGVQRGQVNSLGSLVLPVYVDLLRLSPNAAPADFFELLLTSAYASARLQIERFDERGGWAHGNRASADLAVFEARVAALVRLAGDVDVRFLFLLDEAKRVLGGRFPRGFQDNLFSLMYGQGTGSAYCRFVLAGAQDLYGFCEDETSPIGSRAAKHCVRNLVVADVTAMINAADPGLGVAEVNARGGAVHALTGGHAGVSAYVANRFGRVPDGSVESLRAIVDGFRAERSELFQIWIGSLNEEARAIHDELVLHPRVSLAAIGKILRAANLPAYRADRACEELAFTGLTTSQGLEIVASNRVYFDVAERYVTSEVGSRDERDVWNQVRDVELGLRELIRDFLRRHPRRNLEGLVAGCLGESVLASTLSMRERSRPDATLPKLDLLHFLFLGQLVRLLLRNPVWQRAKQVFRDKRWLEDRIRDIAPVRNDCAHFRPVADDQLARCRLACFDLLTQLEKGGIR